MITSISWKNVWRNKTRSIVVIAAFTIGIFSGIFSVATMKGMMERRIENAIKNESSHIQIHHPSYLDNNELKYTIDHYPVLVDSIMTLPQVEALSPRIKIMGMASTSGNASGVMINGVEPDDERMVTGIDESIIPGAGNFFAENDKKPIIIGEKMAKVLKLVYYELNEDDLAILKADKKLDKTGTELDKLAGIRNRTEKEFDQSVLTAFGKSGSTKYLTLIKEQATKYKMRHKIVLSFQSLDGHIACDAFRVSGIFRTANAAFDGMNAYVIKEDISSIANMPDEQVNEIAVRLKNIKSDAKIKAQIQGIAPTLAVETWLEILPEARMITEMMDFFMMIFMVIILLALGFGIVNTMLMAVLERVKELGMLMAVGMNKTRVFIMIMLETVFLGLTGSVFGIIISYLLILWTGKTGIDLSHLYKEGLEAMGFDAMLYPALSFGSYVEVVFMVILTGIIASIYPARKAIKLKPAEAIRIDM